MTEHRFLKRRKVSVRGNMSKCDGIRQKSKMANRSHLASKSSREDSRVHRQSLDACCPANPRRRRNLKILLVEDDFTSRVMLQGLLLPYGQCHVAVNGREAVDAFSASFTTAKRYDLICMDVRMPEMDGTEAVRQIRSIEELHGVLSTSGVKIFMISAIGDLKTVSSSYGSLCDAYLLKPVTGVQLQQHLTEFKLLNRHSRQR